MGAGALPLSTYTVVMAVRSGFPILSTDDLDRLVDFYCEAFGAERVYAFPDDDGKDAYVALRVGDTALGIGRENGPLGAHARVALWFYVDDVDESYLRALGAGATSESEPAEMPWGERVARVRDPDGLIISLGAER